jgi:hypothetical protein
MKTVQRLDIGTFATFEEAKAFVQRELDRGQIAVEPAPAIYPLGESFVVVGTTEVSYQDVVFEHN